jgi:hypothetical protein
MANDSAPGSTARRRELHLNRARSAAALAERVVDRIAPLSTEPVSIAIVSFYREAAFWALTVDHTGPLPATPSEALACVNNDVLLAAAGGAIGLERVREALARTFIADADLTPAQRFDETQALRGFVRQLMAVSEAPNVARRRIVLWRRTLAALACVLLPAAAFIVGRDRDLADHRPWRASSKFTECDLPSNTCLGSPVDIFFHTLQEDSPWVEIDLGRIQTFSTVAIRNRLDCCRERAVPLAVEVSTDGIDYKQVARRDDIFSVWDAKFPAVQARYVRARALRQTILHFERITVR